jgi:ABC-type branched-subunit amino acid transport system ATPase component
MAALLEARNLVKDFGGIRAINKLDFTLETGKITGLIGPNGSGKTTFFNLITGMYAVSAGDILFGTQRDNLVRLKPHQITRRGIARTFQNQRLFNNMTVLENVMVGTHCRTRSGVLGAIVRTPATRRELRAVSDKALALLGLFGNRLLSMQDQPAWTLSYANRRRLEIARALATDPLLLLLDEPAAGMNPQESKELMGDIQRIRERGTTLLVIEHDMTVVRGVCEWVVALDHGSKIAEGPFEAVRANAQVIEAYLGRQGRRAEAD